MSNAGHDHSFRRAITAELVSNNDPGFAPSRPQQLAKEPDCGKPIPLRLHEDVEDHAALINRSPQVVSDTIDLQEDFVQMPFIAGSSTSSPQPVGILLAELITPAPDRLIGDDHTACSHHVFDIAKAHAETKVMPYAF